MDVLTGHRGAKIINDTEPHEIEASLIQFSPDATVVVLKINGSNENIAGEYVSTIGNPTGGNGIAPTTSGTIFSHIQLGAGSCTYVR